MSQDYIKCAKLFEKEDYTAVVKEADLSIAEIIKMEQTKECVENLNLLYYFRGYSYIHLKQPEKALEDFLRMVELNKDDAENYVHIGFAYDDIGDLVKAEQNFMTAYKMKSYSGAANLADIMLRKGKFQEALAYGLKALEWESDDNQIAKMNIFEAYVNLGDIANASIYARILLKEYYGTAENLIEEFKKYTGNKTFKGAINSLNEQPVASKELKVVIPKELSAIESLISPTYKKFVSIELAKLPEGQEVAGIETMSRVGGYPYLTDLKDFPKNSKGKYLFHLAQINFADIPKLDGFPKEGILQFYMLPDPLFGLNFRDKTKQDGFRVIYHKDVTDDKSKIVSDFSFLPEYKNDSKEPLPLVDSKKVYRMMFEPEIGPISYTDYRFTDEMIDKSLAATKLDEDDFAQLYTNFSKQSGHKIGGYPHFTQEDPRGRKTVKDKGYELLFQLDTDMHANLQWGDMGICNFFINMNDLKQLDFTDVLYNWDCY